MTEGQYKELVEFLEDDKMTIVVEKTANNTVEMKIAKEVDKDVFHYILITIPIAKEL